MGHPLDYIGIATSHFSPEESAAVVDAPPDDRPATFLRIWTRREAVLKAAGVGLSGLWREPPCDAAAPDRWAVHTFAPAPAAVASLALPEPVAAPVR